MGVEPVIDDLDVPPNPDIDELAAVPELAPDVGTPPPEDALLDSAGAVFDPKVHATKRDGSPSYTKSGRFRKVRTTKATAANDENPEDRRYRTAAEGTVAAIEMLATMVGGEAFTYIKDKKSASTSAPRVSTHFRCGTRAAESKISRPASSLRSGRSPIAHPGSPINQCVTGSRRSGRS